MTIRYKASPEFIDRARYLAESGLQAKQVARALHVTYEAIRAIAKREKIAFRVEWTPERLEDLAQFAASGGTQPRAAARYGVSVRTLKTVAKFAGITFPRKGYAPIKHLRFPHLKEAA